MSHLSVAKKLGDSLFNLGNLNKLINLRKFTYLLSYHCLRNSGIAWVDDLPQVSPVINFELLPALVYAFQVLLFQLNLSSIIIALVSHESLFLPPLSDLTSLLLNVLLTLLLPERLSELLSLLQWIGWICRSYCTKRLFNKLDWCVVLTFHEVLSFFLLILVWLHICLN